MAVDAGSNAQQILQGVLDVPDQAIRVSGTVTTTSGPQSFTYNGVTTTVTYDNSTPANNRGLPVVQLASEGGSPVDMGAGASDANTQRVVLSTDSTVGVTGTVAVSATSLPLPTGAATSANQTNGTQVTQVSNFPATQPVSGTVAATQSGTWTVQPGNTANTTPWLMTINQGGNTAIVTVAGALTVDGSAVIQPISATSLPLPTGAATSANQTTANTSLSTIATNTTPLAQGSTTSGQSGQLSMGAVTTAAPSYTTGQTDALSLTPAGALRTDGSATTQPISGTVTVSGTIPTSPNLSRIQAPVLFDGSTLQAAGGTRQALTTLSGDVKRFQIADTTGTFIGVYDAPTSGNLLFIINPGCDTWFDISIANGTALYLISMTTDAGSASTFISFNFLG